MILKSENRPLMAIGYLNCKYTSYLEKLHADFPESTKNVHVFGFLFFCFVLFFSFLNYCMILVNIRAIEIFHDCYNAIMIQKKHTGSIF